MKTYLYRYCQGDGKCYGVRIIAEEISHDGFQYALEHIALLLQDAKSLWHFDTVEAHNRHEAQARAEAACGLLVQTH